MSYEATAWRSAGCFRRLNIAEAYILTTVRKTHTGRHGVENAGCNDSNHLRRLATSFPLTHSFMVTTIHDDIF